jgi:hypothetical protein
MFIATAAVAVACAVWIMNPGNRSTPTEVVLGFAVLFVFPIVLLRLLLFMMDRPASTRRFDQFQNADEAISAAIRLDVLARWEEAAEIYRLSAERWPEHRPFIERCVEEIAKKRSSTRPTD